jgi:peptidoglycan hydrolase-like protein with peptidoglycan-binding domain
MAFTLEQGTTRRKLLATTDPLLLILLLLLDFRGLLSKTTLEEGGGEDGNSGQQLPQAVRKYRLIRGLTDYPHKFSFYWNGKDLAGSPARQSRMS